MNYTPWELALIIDGRKIFILYFLLKEFLEWHEILHVEFYCGMSKMMYNKANSSLFKCISQQTHGFYFVANPHNFYHLLCLPENQINEWLCFIRKNSLHVEEDSVCLLIVLRQAFFSTRV